MPTVSRVGNSQCCAGQAKATAYSGLTIFHLPLPVPQWINVAEVSCMIWDCSDFEKSNFATSEVLERGIVAFDRCDQKGKRTGKIVAKPGEVILLARPLRFWERMQD